MDLRSTVQRLLRHFGIDVTQFSVHSSSLARRLHLLRHYDVNLLLDVGANTGQYVQIMRSYGYSGRVVSFEPLGDVYRQLQAHAAADEAWETVHCALGAEEDLSTINVAVNPQCSSLLPVQDEFVSASPSSAFVAQEQVRVRRLDQEFPRFYQPGDRPYLKIDAQGFEKKVLEGAGSALDHIVGVQMELSLVSLYEGETLLDEMIQYMRDHDFILRSIEPVHVVKETGHMLQVDGVFFREAADEPHSLLPTNAGM